MKKTFLILLASALPIFAFASGFATVITNQGAFKGLDAGITNAAGQTIEQRASSAAIANAMPPSANLTNWSAIATTTKMAAGTGGTIDGGSLTNLAKAPIVVASSGCTVTPTTNATTGQITYTLSVP